LFEELKEFLPSLIFISIEGELGYAIGDDTSIFSAIGTGL
jgi:hypothetical protein